MLPFAKKIFVSYKDLEGISNKYKDKLITVGNIVREEILKTNIPLNEKDESNSLKILVLGGSQAAKRFLLRYYLQFLNKLKNRKFQLKFTNNVKKIRAMN